MVTYPNSVSITRQKRSTMEERTENGETIVTVKTEEEFLAALTHRPEVDGLVIEAPAKVGFRIGGDDVADGSE